VYEEFFILKHHGGWSFFEAYNLPIRLRRWFVQRLATYLEEVNKAEEAEASKIRASSRRK